MLGKFYLEVFRALCMNRSRMRRMLCHLVLDWDGLQLDVGDFDAFIKEPFTDERIG